MTIALRARRNKVTTGAQGMIGQSGVARSPLAPSGQVTVMGEIWNAYSSIPVPLESRCWCAASTG